MMRFVALALVLLTCALAPPVKLRVPSAVPMDGARYRAAMDSAEACSGLHGDFDRVVWRMVPGGNFRDQLDLKTGWVLGLWVPPDTIYVSEQWLNTWVPKHELIHYLRQDAVHEVTMFGLACHAMWGYVESTDSTYRP